MEQFVEKLLTPFVLLCIVCTALGCAYISYKSATNAKKNIVDNGPQNATTFGVMFTFIGIIYALLDFDVLKIIESIPAFLDGMKTAFITSIIGIIFSLIISRVIQKGAVERSKNEMQGQFENISKNSNGIFDVLNNLKESLNTNNSQQVSILNSLNQISQSSAAMANITDAINGLKESIEHSSSGALERTIGHLSNTMHQFIYAAENSQRTLQSVAEKLSEQNVSMKALGAILQKSSEDQIQAIDLLGATLKNSSENQVGAIDLLGQTLQKSGEEQIKSIDLLGATLKNSSENQVGAIDLLGQTLQKSGEIQANAIESLGVELRNSGDEQISRLDTMNATITMMSNFSQKSYENSVTLLDETRDYQKSSLENDREQVQKLAENTERITQMRNAFDEFLHQMAEVFSEQLINAFNKSIKDLNDKLTEQFGDNFKQLNAAVIKLKDWQDNYKATIESTVGELTVLNNTFEKFSTDVAPALAENAERLSVSVDNFTETSARNIEIQANLTDTSKNLVYSIQATEKVAENLKTIHDGLVENQQEILQTMEDSFNAHKEKIVATLQSAVNEFAKMVDKNQTVIISQMQRSAENFDEVMTHNQNTLAAQIQNSADNFKDALTQNQTVVISQMQRAAENFDEVMTHNQNTLAAQIQNSADNFGKILKQNQKFLSAQMMATATNFDKVSEKMEATIMSLRESLNKLDEMTLNVSTNVTDNVTNFSQTAEDVMNRIGAALDGFNTDFQNELQDAMSQLKASFETVTKMHGEQGRLAAEQLAAALGEITKRMVGNYNALVDRIAEVDRLIVERRTA